MWLWVIDVRGSCVWRVARIELVSSDAVFDGFNGERDAIADQYSSLLTRVSFVNVSFSAPKRGVF